MRVQTALRGTAAAVRFLVLVIALAELAAWVLLRLSIGTLPSRSEIQASLAPRGGSSLGRQIPEQPRPPDFMRQHVLHPYLGFVRNPEIQRHVFNSRLVSEPVNEHGFFGPSPLESGDPKTVRVAITGGSVAADLYLRSAEALRTELRRSPQLEGAQIRLVCLALDGMKQPQQLLALQYFIALGASFDVVINLDGFNEIALPFAENAPAGLPVALPRSWQLLIAPLADDRSAILVARMSEKRGQIERARGFFSREPFRRSNLSLLLWDRLHSRLRSELVALEGEFRDLLRRSQEGHPDSRVRPIEEVLADATELWNRSSIQMWKACRSNGSLYVHLLQPNQYVAGSKPLDAEERRMEWPPDFPHRLAAEQGYPLLIAAGERLKRLGVPFRDLTRVFEAERETIYVDPCCHYNQRGNDMLAAEIGRFVAASLEAERAPLPGPSAGPDERPAS